MRLPGKKLLTLPILIIMLGTWLLWPQGNPEAGWYDDNWQYRKKVTVTNNTSAETNRYVTLGSITTTDTSRFQTDCGNVRFTKANGELLPYTVANCNGGSTSFNIQFDALAAGAQDVYMYYGNTNAPDGYITTDFTVASNYSMGTPASEETTPGPVAAWSFDEGTGSTTEDGTANNNDGTLGTGTSAPTWVAEDRCISGKCLQFDGTNDYVNTTYAPNLGTGNFSISLWFRTATSNIVPIGSTAETGAQDEVVQLYIDAGGGGCSAGYLDFVARDTDSSSTNLACSNRAVNDNKWHHAVAVFNNTSSLMNLYLDGQLSGSTSITANSNGAKDFTGYPFYIGSNNNRSVPESFFKGFIDDVRIYPFARTADQIKTDFAARGSTKGVSAQFGSGGPGSGEKLSNGLVGYWKLDDNTGTSVADSSGNTYTGTLGTGSSAPTWATGKFGPGLSFDGADDYVDLNDGITNTADLTVSAWIYPDTISGTDTIAQNGTCCGGASWYLNLGSGIPSFGISSNGTALTTVDAPNAISTAAWHHILGVYTPGKSLQIYVDGVLAATNTTSIPSSQVDTAGNDIHIGRRNVSGGDRFFDGQIDEIRVYSRTLEPREVRALYTWAPGPVGHWKLDEGTGTTSINDSSGNGLTGTLTSVSESFWSPGKFGSALHFTADGQYITMSGEGSILSRDQFSYSAWIKLDDVNNDYYILDNRDANDDGTRFYTTNAGDLLRCSYNAINADSTIALVPNTWYHAACTSDGTTLKVFINGVLSGSNTLSGSISESTNMRISSFSYNAGNGHFGGIIDDVKAYNYARTPAQVIEDMNGSHPVGGSPVGSQVGYWTFDEGYGTTAYDTSPNQNNMTLSTATSAWTNSGKFGKAWDGNASRYVSRADDADFDFIAAEDFTMSAWIKSDGTATGVQYILNKASSSAPGYALYGVSGTGRVLFGIDDDTTWSPDDTATSTTDVYDQAWHYIAARKIGTSRIDLFVDGRLEGSDTTIGALGSLTNSVALYIGDRDGTDNGDEYNGDIDEVKIYRGALTDEQIQLDYNQGQATVMGALSTASDGSSASFASAREYCIPGDTSTCNAPVGEWKFDEHTGTTANDTSGNGLTGTLNSFPSTPWSAGKNGSALVLDGTDDDVSVGTSDTLNLTTFTMSAWIYPYSNGEAGIGTIINRGNQVPSGYDIGITGNDLFIYKATCNTLTFDDSDAITLNKWNHVALTSNGSTIAGYVNGRKYTTTHSCALASSASTATYIGSYDGDTETFHGRIDDLRMYNYVRTPAQIAWEYNRGAPVAHYQFDECQGTTAFNNALNGNNQAAGNNGTITIGASGTNTSAGTCTGSAGEAWKDGANGKINSSLEFDGTDDTVSIGTPTVLNDLGPYTIAFWLKPRTAHTAYTVAKRGVSGTGAWRVALENTNNITWFKEYSGTDIDISSRTNVITVGSWNHVAVTWDGSSSAANAYTYVNGVDVTNTRTDATGSIQSDAALPLYLGSRANSNSYLDGQLDDVRIYNYALTGTQVKTLYNGGSAVQFAPITGSP